MSTAKYSENSQGYILKKDDMWAHEHNCFYNLNNKTCFTCIHNNRNYNPVNELNTSCELGLLHAEPCQTTSMFIKQQCDKWKDKFSIDESELTDSGE